MVIALSGAGLNVEEQVPVPVWYRGQQLGDFRVDILVNGCVLLELKAVERLDRSHSAQTLNYLRATDLEVGLLLNFGHTRPEFRRLLFDNDKKRGGTQAKTATAP